MIAISTRIETLFSYLVDQTRKQSTQLAAEIDLHAVGVFSWVLATEAPTAKDGGKLIAINAMAQRLNNSRGTCDRRMRLLAMFGFWNVVRSEQIRAPYEVTVNPTVIRLIESRVPLVEVKQAITRLVRIGIVRASGAESLQGFRSHVAYGEREISTVLRDRTADDRLGDDERDLFAEATADAEKAHRLETDKERAKREKAKLAAKANRFIEVCAELWQRGQIAYGRMNPAERVAPNWWAANPKQLTDVLRREYKELESTWLRYGTMRVGMAWRYFNGQAPLKDAKDRVQFIPDIPHIQWSSLDKKPTHFAKHLNALFCDPVFRSWMEDDARLAKVRADYGDELCAWQGNGQQPATGGMA
jgi:hypothetical protein